MLRYCMCYTKIIIFAAIIFNQQSCFAQKNTATSKNQNYAEKNNYTQSSRVILGEIKNGLAVNGMVSGRINETSDSIIIDGAKFVRDKSNASVEIKSANNKNIILNNIQMLSNNADASLIKIDGSAKSVTMRNIKIRANNTAVHNETCGAMICASAANVKLSDVDISVSGNNSFSSGTK